MRTITKTITAIAAPCVCFFAAWSLARTPGAPITTIAEKSDPQKPEVKSVEQLTSEMEALPEWDLARWNDRLELLSAEELRELIRSQHAAIGDSPGPERQRLALAVGRLGELEGGRCLPFVEELSSNWNLLNAALGGWVKSDPRGAVLSAATDEKLSRHAQRLFWHAAEENCQLAIELLDHHELADHHLRAAFIGNVAQVMAKAPAEEAFAWYERLEPGERSGIRDNFFKQQAMRNPVATAELVAKLPPGQARLPALSVAANWAEADPQAAIAWSDSLPQGDLAWDARRAAINRWSDSDPVAAWEYLRVLDGPDALAILEETFDWQSAQATVGQPFYDPFGGHSPSGSNPLMNSLMDSLPRPEKSQLIEMMGDSPNAQHRQTASRAALFELAKTDPAGAIAQTAEIELGNIRSHRDGFSYFPLQPIIDNASGGDSQAAFDIALTFPEKHRREALSYSLATLTHRDPESAGALIDTVEPGPLRDAAFEGYAEQLVELDAARAAVEFTAYIDGDAVDHDSQFVFDISRSVVHRWSRNDPQGAGEWVASLQHPQARKHALEALRQRFERADSETATSRLEELGFSPEEIGGR